MTPSRARRTSRQAAPRKAWEGRFTQGPDPRAEAFTESLSVDLRLLPFDIQGSLAHAAMLGATGILSRREAALLQQGLKRILDEWRAGRLTRQPSDEDVHMLVERRLTEELGPVAGKLHTARSRNDQVVTDLKLFLRTAVEELGARLQTVQRSLLRQAEAHADWIMPGYTHLQVAQPVLVAHWLLAHLEAFARDEARLRQLRKGPLEELPLGAAALAGTSHPIDRAFTARRLGFARISANSMDTVGDRDFGVEFLAAAALCGVHLSRLAEELVLFSSAEFRFITMPQAFSTGSSIMPQKRNPDVAELIRGKTGRLHGNLTALLTVLKGLPLTYNRDLQEDKALIFDSLDILDAALSVLAPMLDGLVFDRRRMEAACGRGFPTATEAADHLVRQGVPFREAHAAVGRAVTAAADRGRTLEELSLQDWQAVHRGFGPGVARDVSLRQAVAAKTSPGGTAPGQVRRAMLRVRARLAAKKGK